MSELGTLCIDIQLHVQLVVILTGILQKLEYNLFSVTSSYRILCQDESAIPASNDGGLFDTKVASCSGIHEKDSD